MKLYLKPSSLSTIQKGWVKITLGEVVTFQRGYDLPLNKRRDGPYPIVASNGIVGYHSEYRAKGPGITIGRSGNLGIPTYIAGNYWPHNTTLFSLTFHESDPKFVYYLLNTLKLGRFNAGSAVPTLNRNHIHPIEVIIPNDMNTQHAIAKILSDLDEKIELNMLMNKTLESITQAIFKRWFVDFEFPDKNGEPYKSNGGDMVDSELGEIPKTWKVNRIKDIVAEKKYSIVDGPFGTQLHNNEYVSEGVPVIRIINLTFDGRFINEGLVFITEDKFNLLKRSAVYPGDILLAKTGATIGKLSIMPHYIEKALIASSILKISPNQNNKFYLYNIIKNLSNKNYWERISAGSTRSTINLIDIKDISIIVPEIRILKVFENILQNIYFIIENNEKQNHNLKQIRDSLLPRLMSGKIRLEV